MVVFEDGLPRKDHYRRFSVPASTDDTESIYQVISRRLAYLTPAAEPAPTPPSSATEPVETPIHKFSYPPQLLIVDGGQPQVAAAARALKESGVTGIQLAGIAKRLEELWLPDSDYPVILPRNSDALFMIQRIRDEAHRFAITYQRARRKRDIASMLGEIPGLGPARVRELLRHFGSVTQLRKADVEQISEVKGIGGALAEAIHSALRSR
jgi:excinuclease ABC subunit C